MGLMRMVQITHNGGGAHGEGMAMCIDIGLDMGLIGEVTVLIGKDFE